MHIVGADFLQRSIAMHGYVLKLIFNERTAHFFPSTTEHRDASLPGLQYRDESTGDAVAATIQPARIDICLHKSYSAERMLTIVSDLEIALGSVLDSSRFTVNYGGSYLRTIGRSDLAGDQS